MLALAIVERIGRLLGHRIGLRSMVDKGNVFCVTAALGKAEAVVAPAPVVAPADPGDESPLRRCPVWSIDDDPRARAATRALLERWGCNVELADGLQAAVEIASAFNVPQLLLLDVRMGEWHGRDLYEELCLPWQVRPPLILVTAERDDALKAHAAEQGWGFLPKPVRPPALRAVMTQLLVRQRRPGGVID
ncbi:response regulator [Stenotrophomonas sp.]|uniref:response regulator n=1 Tax=Stenotrophomonas sp. TaxID=69392 RepID=UPI0028AE6A0B|nr:response regulator [Stenotrophomonas sp.]